MTVFAMSVKEDLCAGAKKQSRPYVFPQIAASATRKPARFSRNDEDIGIIYPEYQSSNLMSFTRNCKEVFPCQLFSSR